LGPGSGAGAVAEAAGGPDPGKVVLDVALTSAVDGDYLTDIALMRAKAGLHGQVASDPTVSHVGANTSSR
jgi:hypothetical protein